MIVSLILTPFLFDLAGGYRMKSDANNSVGNIALNMVVMNCSDLSFQSQLSGLAMLFCIE